MVRADPRCPTCRGPAKLAKDGNKAFPFCCTRCQLVDLGRWLDEEYRVPGEPVDPDEIDPGGRKQ